MNGRHRRVPGGLIFIYPAKKSLAIKTGRTHHASAPGQGGEQRADQTMDVEKRHDVQTSVLLAQRQKARNIRSR